MVIYDSLLAGKRVLFSGDSKQNSVEEVQDYMFACQQLISPPLIGSLNLFHPYIDLNTSDLLEDCVYIGGVINPLFKSSKAFKDNYDVLIPIERPTDTKQKSQQVYVI